MKKIFSIFILTSLVLSTAGAFPMVLSADNNHDNSGNHSEDNHNDNGKNNGDHNDDGHGDNGGAHDNDSHGDNHDNHNDDHGNNDNHGGHGDHNGDNDNENNNPQTPTCDTGEHLDIDTNTCVVDALFVPTCTDLQHLDTETNTCIDNPVISPTPTPTPTPDPTPVPPTDNTSDNNGGGSSDVQTTPSNSGPGIGNGPIFGSFGVINGQNNNSNNGGDNGNVGDGKVLGASCTPSVTSYIGFGNKNDPEQVKKLQTFLNNYLHLNIPVNGVYGPQTLAAVKQFQLQEYSEVLTPWFKAGLMKSDKEPTGYVYKTTLRRINMLSCSALDIPVPQLP